MPPVMQELAVGEGHAAQLGDALGVRVLGWQLPRVLRPSATPLGEQVFSGGDEARPLKVVLSTSSDARPHCWEAGLLGMRKGGVRYVAVAVALVALDRGRVEARPSGA